MILKFEDFITEQSIINSIDIDEINESKKEAKRLAEIAKKQIKKWDKNKQNAYNEYLNALRNTKLMNDDYEKYFNECIDKLKKYQSLTMSEDEDKSLCFSYIIYLIASIKEIQTNLFKDNIPYFKKLFKNHKEILSKKGQISDETIDRLLDNNRKYHNTAIESLTQFLTKQFETSCDMINDYINMTEEYSDVSPIVFGDAKIKNKERSKKHKEFITVYHSDIEKFVKDYKLLGFEYDKRIQWVDKREIFRRLFKKLNEISKEIM